MIIRAWASSSKFIVIREEIMTELSQIESSTVRVKFCNPTVHPFTTSDDGLTVGFRNPLLLR